MKKIFIAILMFGFLPFLSVSADTLGTVQFETPSYGDTVQSIAVTDTHVWYGGMDTNTVKGYHYALNTPPVLTREEILFQQDLDVVDGLGLNSEIVVMDDFTFVTGGHIHYTFISNSVSIGKGLDEVASVGIELPQHERLFNRVGNFTPSRVRFSNTSESPIGRDIQLIRTGLELNSTEAGITFGYRPIFIERPEETLVRFQIFSDILLGTEPILVEEILTLLNENAKITFLPERQDYDLEVFEGFTCEGWPLNSRHEVFCNDLFDVKYVDRIGSGIKIITNSAITFTDSIFQGYHTFTSNIFDFGVDLENVRSIGYQFPRNSNMRVNIPSTSFFNRMDLFNVSEDLARHVTISSANIINSFPFAYHPQHIGASSVISSGFDGLEKGRLILYTEVMDGEDNELVDDLLDIYNEGVTVVLLPMTGVPEGEEEETVPPEVPATIATFNFDEEVVLEEAFENTLPTPPAVEVPEGYFLEWEDFNGNLIDLEAFYTDSIQIFGVLYLIPEPTPPSEGLPTSLADTDFSEFESEFPFWLNCNNTNIAGVLRNFCIDMAMAINVGNAENVIVLDENTGIRWSTTFTGFNTQFVSDRFELGTSLNSVLSLGLNVHISNNFRHSNPASSLRTRIDFFDSRGFLIATQDLDDMGIFVANEELITLSFGYLRTPNNVYGRATSAQIRIHSDIPMGTNQVLVDSLIEGLEENTRLWLIPNPLGLQSVTTFRNTGLNNGQTLFFSDIPPIELQGGRFSFEIPFSERFVFQNDFISSSLIFYNVEGLQVQETFTLFVEGIGNVTVEGGTLDLELISRDFLEGLRSSPSGTYSLRFDEGLRMSDTLVLGGVEVFIAGDLRVGTASENLAELQITNALLNEKFLISYEEPFTARYFNQGNFFREVKFLSSLPHYDVRPPRGFAFNGWRVDQLPIEGNQFTTNVDVHTFFTGLDIIDGVPDFCLTDFTGALTLEQIQICMSIVDFSISTAEFCNNPVEDLTDAQRNYCQRLQVITQENLTRFIQSRTPDGNTFVFSSVGTDELTLRSNIFELGADLASMEFIGINIPNYHLFADFNAEDVFIIEFFNEADDLIITRSLPQTGIIISSSDNSRTFGMLAVGGSVFDGVVRARITVPMDRSRITQPVGFTIPESTFVNQGLSLLNENVFIELLPKVIRISDPERITTLPSFRNTGLNEGTTLFFSDLPAVKINSEKLIFQVPSSSRFTLESPFSESHLAFFDQFGDVITETFEVEVDGIGTLEVINGVLKFEDFSRDGRVSGTHLIRLPEGRRVDVDTLIDSFEVLITADVDLSTEEASLQEIARLQNLLNNNFRLSFRDYFTATYMTGAEIYDIRPFLTRPDDIPFLEGLPNNLVFDGWFESGENIAGRTFNQDLTLNARFRQLGQNINVESPTIPNVPEGLDGLFIRFGLDNLGGYIFAYLVVVVALTVFALLLKLPEVLLFVGYMAVTASFVSFGIMPIWLSFIAFMAIITGIFFTMRKGVS